MSVESGSSAGADCMTPPRVANIDIQEERRHILDLLTKAQQLATFSRVRSPLLIRLRIESARALGYLASVRASVVKDFALNELEARLKLLEETMGKK